jgi:hypothetical protein
MVANRPGARRKNVGDRFVVLAFNHPMKDLGFSRCQSYSLKILGCRNRAGRCLLERGERLGTLIGQREALRSRWSARDAWRACHTFQPGVFVNRLVG